jgi:hypothetical protein
MNSSRRKRIREKMRQQTLEARGKIATGLLNFESILEAVSGVADAILFAISSGKAN